MFKSLNDSKSHYEADIDYKDLYIVVKDVDEKDLTDRKKRNIGYFKTLRSFDSTLAN
jgi:hypothetical protein